MTRDFTGGPVVKNPPSSAGDMGSIPGRGTKIPHAAGQVSPVPQLLSPRAPQLQSPRATNYRAHVLWSPLATTREKPVRHSEESARHNERSRVPQLRPNAAKKIINKQTNK